MQIDNAIKYAVIGIIGLVSLFFLNFMATAFGNLANDDFTKVLFWIGLIELIILIPIIGSQVETKWENIGASVKWFISGLMLCIILNIVFPILVGLLTDTKIIALSWIILTVTEVLALTAAPVLRLNGS